MHDVLDFFSQRERKPHEPGHGDLSNPAQHDQELWKRLLEPSKT